MSAVFFLFLGGGGGGKSHHCIKLLKWKEQLTFCFKVTMYLTHFFSSNVITIVSHCCGFLEADRRNKLLQLTVLICHTEQLADSYYVNEIWREGYFSSWAIRVIESNHIRAQGGKHRKIDCFCEGNPSALRTASAGCHLQVQRLGKGSLLSKSLGFDQNIFSVRKMPLLSSLMNHYGCLSRYISWDPGHRLCMFFS